MKNLVVSSFALLVSAALTPIAPAQAQDTQQQSVSAPYQQRVDQLLTLLQGAEIEEEFFAQSFLNAVPVPQFRALTAQLKKQYGEPQSISRIIPASERDGTVEIAFDKATLAVRMVVDQAEPHPVIGLLVTGAKVRDDGLSKIAEEFEALPGKAGFEIAALDGDRLRVIAAHNNEIQFGIGSTFKLYVLAELDRSIRSGQRNWDDIVRINQKSLPSGVLQNWPDNAPLTLQSLATLMISISDNTATDLLINKLGRENIADIIRATGHADPSRMLPVLSTVEFFALKMPQNSDLRASYLSATDSQQEELLKKEQSRLSRDTVAIENLANKPMHIEEIEWFAAPSDISKLLQYLQESADPVTRAILAISNDIGPGDRARWAYLGSKGGSEPGVISFAFLATSKSGRKYAISGSWNDRNAPVDNAKFQMLMNRLLNLAADQAN